MIQNKRLLMGFVSFAILLHQKYLNGLKKMKVVSYQSLNK